MNAAKRRSRVAIMVDDSVAIAKRRKPPQSKGMREFLRIVERL